MSDEPIPPDESPKKINPPPAAKEDDWGEDWESAFQAEEDMFFAEAGEEDFFIDETQEPAPDEAAGKEPAPVPKKKPPAASPRRFKASLSTISLRTLPATLKSYLLRKSAGALALIKTISAKTRTLPVSLRAAVYGAPFLLIIIAFAGSLLLQRPQQPPTPDRTAEEAPPELADGQEPPDSGEPFVQIYPDPARKKWKFPGFIIPVRSEAGDKSVTFLLIDITIISVLSGEEAPPADKEHFMRDIIYQFFINRPQDELHHFSLARGEMQRKLKGWILKQWPDAPIESIIFDRYFFS